MITIVLLLVSLHLFTKTVTGNKTNFIIYKIYKYYIKKYFFFIRNACEMNCENLRNYDPCPVIDNLCFPGCYCPDGLIRNEDTCITPIKCGDCICNVVGNSKYVSFDQNIVKLHTSCTTVLSKGKNNDGLKYEVKFN